jgi:hypothetical protein
MNTAPVVLGGLLAAMACTAASARFHHICYEDVPDGKTVRMIVGCQDDAGKVCTVTALSPGVGLDAQYLQGWHPRVAPGVPFTPFTFVGSGSGAGGTMSFSIKFDDGTTSGLTRFCTVSARGTLSSPSGASNGVLTGFSSDESGRVSTGAWRVTMDGSIASLAVPGDFIVSGGGFESTSSPGDPSFLRVAQAAPAVLQAIPPAGPNAPITFWWDRRAWLADGRTAAAKAAPSTTAHVIGLRIEGLDMAFDLVKDLAFDAAFGGSSLAPAAVAVPTSPDRVILGGEVEANSTGRSRVGQLVTGTAGEAGLQHALCTVQWMPQPCPVPTARSWRVKSNASPLAGTVSALVMSLPPTITVQGKTWEVRSRLVTAGSARQFNPSAVASGLRGRYAVTGVGAMLRGQPVMTRLSAVVPRLDVGGAAAAAGSTLQELASIQASAVGVRLVEPGTPPDLDEPRTLKAPVDVDWLCRVVPDLAGNTSLCDHRDQLLSVEKICAFEDLQKYGLCLRKP